MQSPCANALRRRSAAQRPCEDARCVPATRRSHVAVFLWPLRAAKQHGHEEPFYLTLAEDVQMRYGLPAEPGMLGTCSTPALDTRRSELQMLVTLLPANVQCFIQGHPQLQEVRCTLLWTGVLLVQASSANSYHSVEWGWISPSARTL